MKILKFFLEKAFNGKNKGKIRPLIAKLYRQMATEDLVLNVQAVKVKKGKRRYEVLFIETAAGKQRVMITG